MTRTAHKQHTKCFKYKNKMEKNKKERKGKQERMSEWVLCVTKDETT